MYSASWEDCFTDVVTAETTHNFAVSCSEIFLPSFTWGSCERFRLLSCYNRWYRIWHRLDWNHWFHFSFNLRLPVLCWILQCSYMHSLGLITSMPGCYHDKEVATVKTVVNALSSMKFKTWSCDWIHCTLLVGGQWVTRSAVMSSSTARVWCVFWPFTRDYYNTIKRRKVDQEVWV